MIAKFPLAVALAAIVMVGCDKQTVDTTPSAPPVAKTKTFETARLEASISAYEREPTSLAKADVEKAMAELDGEIAELKERVAKTSGADREEAAVKLANLEKYRGEQTVRFTKAQVVNAPAGAESSGKSAAQKVEDSAKKAGNAIEDAAKNAADAVKDAVR